MKKKMVIILLVMFMLGACRKEEIDPKELCLEKARGYYDSLVEADLEKQMEYLEAFALDKEQYQESFLQYVKGGKLHELTVEHEDDLLVMIKLDMDLILSSDFKENVSLKPGTNRIQRYLSYYKTDNYRLKEILNKAIY